LVDFMQPGKGRQITVSTATSKITQRMPVPTQKLASVSGRMTGRISNM
jgi:hypothetical protein